MNRKVILILADARALIPHLQTFSFNDWRGLTPRPRPSPRREERVPQLNIVTISTLPGTSTFRGLYLVDQVPTEQETSHESILAGTAGVNLCVYALSALVSLPLILGTFLFF